MLYQLHHQHRNGLTDFLAQTKIADVLPCTAQRKILTEWVLRMQIRHPLPANCSWLLCKQSDPQFMVCSRKEN